MSKNAICDQIGPHYVFHLKKGTIKKCLCMVVSMGEKTGGH